MLIYFLFPQYHLSVKDIFFLKLITRLLQKKSLIEIVTLLKAGEDTTFMDYI